MYSSRMQTRAHCIAEMLPSYICIHTDAHRAEVPLQKLRRTNTQKRAQRVRERSASFSVRLCKAAVLLAHLGAHVPRVRCARVPFRCTRVCTRRLGVGRRHRLRSASMGNAYRQFESLDIDAAVRRCVDRVAACHAVTARTTAPAAAAL